MAYQFNQQIFIPVAPEGVYQHITNLNNFPGLHPFVIDINIKKTGIDNDGTPITDFISHEQIKLLGSLKFTFPVQGQCRRNDAQQIVEFKTRVEMFNIDVRVQDIFECQASGQGTQLIERVKLVGTPIVSYYAGWLTKRVHKKMLEQLRERLINSEVISQPKKSWNQDSLLKDKVNS